MNSSVLEIGKIMGRLVSDRHMTDHMVIIGGQSMFGTSNFGTE